MDDRGTHVRSQHSLGQNPGSLILPPVSRWLTNSTSLSRQFGVGGHEPNDLNYRVGRFSLCCLVISRAPGAGSTTRVACFFFFSIRVVFLTDVQCLVLLKVVELCFC